MEPRIPKYVPATNVAVKLFTRLGLKTGPVNVITVAGRKTGQPRSAPVTPWVVDGKRYVIAGIAVFEVTAEWAFTTCAAVLRAPSDTAMLCAEDQRHSPDASRGGEHAGQDSDHPCGQSAETRGPDRAQ